MKYSVIIDGNNFSDLEEFYNEMEKILTKDLTWRPGHSLDAFNDLLRGGFGYMNMGRYYISGGLIFLRAGRILDMKKQKNIMKIY